MNLPTIFIMFIMGLLPQQPATIAKSPQDFHWDWRDAQELRARESLRNAQMDSADKSAIVEALEPVIRPYLADLGDESQKRLEEEALNTRVKLIDLDRDGTPEVVAQAMVACGASGNCPFWVLQKKPDCYKLLLEDTVETFTVQKTRTNGFSDIVLASHDSAFEQTIDVYRYEGGAYKDAGCYDAVVAVLDGDVIRRLPEPRLKPCSMK